MSASGFWRGPEGRRAWSLTVLLVVCVLLQLIIQYRLNLWSRDFFDAFGRRDGPALRDEALVFLPLAVASLGTALLMLWARMTTQILWRDWLTKQLIGRWLVDGGARSLHFVPGEDQNPEYRLAEDVRVATDVPVYMVAGLLAAVLSSITFIGVLWQVGGDLVVDIFGRTLTVPKYLVITVALYSALMTVAMMIIGRNLIQGIAGKNAAEAQFRSIASRLREPRGIGAGPTVPHGGADLLRGALSEMIGRWRNLCVELMRITFVSQGNILVAPVVAWVLCAPKYLVGTMSLGEVAQAAAAFVTVQAALNWLVDNFPSLADCLSSVSRVGSLLAALDEHEGAVASSETTGADADRKPSPWSRA